MEETVQDAPTVSNDQSAPSEQPDSQHDDVLAVLEEDTSTNTEPVPQEPRHRVKIDGTERDVDLSELVAGYQKVTSADQRFRAASELQKHAEQMVSAYQQRLEQFIPEREHKLIQMQSELNTLAHDDPASWVAKKQQFDAELMQLNTARAEQQRLSFERETAAQNAHQARVASAYEYLGKAIPGWAPDSAVEKSVSEYAEKLGMPRNIQSAVFSGAPQVGVAVHKAMLYDQLLKKVEARKASPSEQSAAPAPVEPVRSRAPANKDMERMNTPDWMKARNKQVRA